jgi:hypothetical protein
MKSKLLHSLTLLALGSAAVAFTACTKHDRDDLADKTRDAYHDSKDAVARSWDNVKSYTFDKRSDFEKMANAQQKSFEASLSNLRADYSEAKASASRKAAMNELKDAEADYKQKLDALGHATADTWDAARDNVAAAWDRLQASYAKARAD